MYACGLRIGEAAKLELGAIDRANLVLRIVGKGNKERLVPLPQPILDALGRLWCRHRNRRWIFPNQNGDGPRQPACAVGQFHGRRRCGRHPSASSRRTPCATPTQPD